MRIYGVQDKIPLFLALEVFFRVALEEIVKTTIMQVESDIFYCVLGVKKSSNLAQIGLIFFRRAPLSFSDGSPPPGP